ncbi:hypothetical protein G7066_09570 [Leucobacter coleopterorum]|uniref:LPXTG-motif cell wall anchor domain-containing protein n=1 Tax=Leucobacter coleopterorum TaxID=2714933 RepID=A0ABX6K161_9MICO|nr:hypothetical protein [Leucobacter coleopterorum]QIM18785.1 hypothetical protein G7066_09570 [Leucobacter coleopterorum]
MSIGGALVAVGAVATILIGLRRRAQAFGASDAATDSNEHNAGNTDSENER